MLVNKPVVLHQRYALSECLGKSKTGDVYLARDLKLVQIYGATGSHVIIKKLPDYLDTEESRENIAELTSKYSNLEPNKIRFYSDEEEGFLVFQLSKGCLLESWLKGKGLTRNVDDMFTWVIRLNHQLKQLRLLGIYHGMLELDSIYMTDAGHPFVLDSIIIAERQRLQEKGIFKEETVPNKAFINASPDICFGHQWVQQDDVFNVAVLFYQLLARRHPYEGKNSIQSLINKTQPLQLYSISEEQWEVLKKALALQVQNRYESMEAFLMDWKAADSKYQEGLYPYQQASKPRAQNRLKGVGIPSADSIVNGVWLFVLGTLGTLTGALLMSRLLSSVKDFLP